MCAERFRKLLFFQQAISLVGIRLGADQGRMKAAPSHLHQTRTVMAIDRRVPSSTRGVGWLGDCKSNPRQWATRHSQYGRHCLMTMPQARGSRHSSLVLGPLGAVPLRGPCDTGLSWTPGQSKPAFAHSLSMPETHHSQMEMAPPRIDSCIA